MIKNIFSDLHHFGLYNSLKILFEDRIGANLYRPIGEDWLSRGYWRMAEIYNNHPATVAQYLGIRPDYFLNINHWEIWEPQHNYYQKALTVKQFFDSPIDAVIASIPEHISSFKKLCNDHPNKPKLIYQIGNQWPLEAGSADNIMSSAKISGVPSKINYCEYHQEFDLNIFQPGEILNNKNIFSFINCLNTASIYQNDWKLFTELESQMPDWNFKTYGGSCRDGQANGINEVAYKMKQARFLWHVKFGGDGYGHVLFNGAAVGKPAIVKNSYYAGKLGEKLLIDGVTCINIDNLSIPEMIKKINYFNDDNNYIQMSKNVYYNFKQNVNFNEDYKRLQKFLDNLI